MEAAPGPALWERALGVVGFQNACGGCGSPLSGGGGSSAALFLRKPWVCGEDSPPWGSSKSPFKKDIMRGLRVLGSVGSGAGSRGWYGGET